MSEPLEDWENRLGRWAHAQPDIKALVQIGSRVQAPGTSDAWSDYDYQLITATPSKYRDGSFAKEIAPCWNVGAHWAFGGALKVTGVYEGALEADFVILGALDLRIAFAALRWPFTRALWPRPLSRGVRELSIVAAPGWRVLKGGEAWERRYRRIKPVEAGFTQGDFDGLCGNFFSQAVWAAKKRSRGEFLACQRCVHEHLFESLYRLLHEAAQRDKGLSYPLARRAESWMAPQVLKALSRGVRPDPESLSGAILESVRLFDEAAASTAARNGWPYVGRAELREWLQRHLST